MPSVRPRVTPQVAVAAAHGDFGNNNAKTAFVFGRHQRKYPAIRFTINQIVDIAALAFIPSLIEDTASLEPLRQQIPQLAVGRFVKFTFLDILTDDDVGSQSLCVLPFHVSHEMRCRFQRWTVDEIVVIAESRRSRDEDADKK